MPVIICVALAVSYSCYVSRSRPGRIASVNNLKQIGLAFPIGHNEFAGQFSITGSVVVPNLER